MAGLTTHSKNRVTWLLSLLTSLPYLVIIILFLLLFNMSFLQLSTFNAYNCGQAAKTNIQIFEYRMDCIIALHLWRILYNYHMQVWMFFFFQYCANKAANLINWNVVENGITHKWYNPFYIPMFLKCDPYRVWCSIFYSKLVNCILFKIIVQR
jgi:hypothetical protein